MVSKAYILSRRTDLSSFLVHLTRSRKIRRQGETVTLKARDVLVSILKAGCIRAKNFHCLFNKDLLTLDTVDAAPFKTVCFSETPLSDINYLTQEIEGRAIRLTQYGLVFRKATVVNRGGNPVIYVSNKSVNGRSPVAAFKRVYNRAKKSGFELSSESTFLPFVNLFSENYDFSWEREWRVVGDFRFELAEVFLGLAPAKDHAELIKRFPSVQWISPRWGRDQIIEALQKGATRAFAK